MLNLVLWFYNFSLIFICMCKLAICFGDREEVAKKRFSDQDCSSESFINWLDSCKHYCLNSDVALLIMIYYDYFYFQHKSMEGFEITIYFLCLLCSPTCNYIFISFRPDCLDECAWLKYVHYLKTVLLITSITGLCKY